MLELKTKMPSSYFEREASGEISYRGNGDAFTVMRDGARRGDHLVYYFARDHFPDGARFISASGGGLDYYVTIEPTAGNLSSFSPTLGLFSWGPAPIPGRP